MAQINEDLMNAKLIIDTGINMLGEVRPGKTFGANAENKALSMIQRATALMERYLTEKEKEAK